MLMLMKTIANELQFIPVIKDSLNDVLYMPIAQWVGRSRELPESVSLDGAVRAISVATGIEYNTLSTEYSYGCWYVIASDGKQHGKVVVATSHPAPSNWGLLMQ